MQEHTEMEHLGHLLELKDAAAVSQTLAEWPPSHIAELLKNYEEEDQLFLFRCIPEKLQAETFEYLPFGLQEDLLESLPQQRIAYILENMSADDRTTLFEELTGPKVTQLLSLLSTRERQVSLNLLGYPDSSVGRLMTPDYIAVKEYWSVQQVLDYIRRNGRDSETLNVIYVVDDHGYLLDDIRVRELLLADPHVHMSDVMDEQYVALLATDDQEEAVAMFRKHNRVALPVTNNKGVLIGIVTVDDILEVAEEEGTEDIQKLGAVEALDDPYLETPVFEMIKKRGGWLVILFIGEMFTATAMGFFEDEIERAVVLALFIPLIISSGGNTGSQAATLIIRAMALGEVRIRDWWRVMRREILSGLALGTLLGLIGFLRIWGWSLFSDIYGPYSFLVALTVALSLVGVVLWGTISGSMLPLVMKRFGFDPAASSAPFVATLIDVTGLVIYFSIALALLTGTLL